MNKPAKSPEFIEFINGYMTKYAMRRLRCDIDKVQDIVQFAWADALQTVDFSRSDSEVRDYLIQSVKFVISNDSKRTRATATNIHDFSNSILMSEIDHKLYSNGDKPESYQIPKNDHNYGIAELSVDIRKVAHRLSDLERKFFHLVLERGFSRQDAAGLCGRTNQWGQQRCKKLANLLNNE